jgi:hypothetical protein
MVLDGEGAKETERLSLDVAGSVMPTLEALRSLTPAPFREQIALMMERLGHTIITEPSAADLVTVKEGRKFITACARPADPTPTATRDLARLHEAVIAANAHTGIYVTTRAFTREAEEYAATAPIKLVEGEILKRSMNLSSAGFSSWTRRWGCSGSWWWRKARWVMA